MLPIPGLPQPLTSQPGSKQDLLNARKDFKPTTQVLASLRQELGRQNSKTPKKERQRQRPVDEELQAKMEWKSRDWRTYFAQSSSSSSSSQIWWQHEHQDSQWRGHQDTQWRDHQWQDHQWRDHTCLAYIH